MVRQQLAKAELGWAAEHDIERMVGYSWRWQSLSPKGYLVYIVETFYDY